MVRVDQTLSTAAILNLAINARNAMPNGGGRPWMRPQPPQFDARLCFPLPRARATMRRNLKEDRMRVQPSLISVFVAGAAVALALAGWSGGMAVPTSPL